MATSLKGRMASAHPPRAALRKHNACSLTAPQCVIVLSPVLLLILGGNRSTANDETARPSSVSQFPEAALGALPK